MFALAISVGLGVVLGRPAAIEPRSPGLVSVEAPVEGPAAASPVDTIVVHVSGAVLRPGLVELVTGSRVADAVEAAGGAILGADLDSVNLAQAVTDGQQVVVPRAGESVAASPSSDDTVSLNRADARALEVLPGVGPVLAASIVAYREEHGPYMEVEDLLSVPGIGESKLATLRDRVVVP